MSKLSVILMFVAKRNKLQRELDVINAKLHELAGDKTNSHVRIGKRFKGDENFGIYEPVVKRKKKGGWHWSYHARKRHSERMRAYHAKKITA